MGEGVEEPREEEAEPGDQDGLPATIICFNCKTENDWQSSLCKFCFAPLAQSRRKLCPSCMTPCEESAHFCAKCLTPLSAHATIDPVMGITARMDTIGKAASAPRKPIVLLGMWIIFAPVTFFLFLGIVASEGLGKLMYAAMALVPVLILIKTTGNYIKGPPATSREGFPLKEDEGDTAEVGEGKSGKEEDSAGADVD